MMSMGGMKAIEQAVSLWWQSRLIDLLCQVAELELMFRATKHLLKDDEQASKELKQFHEETQEELEILQQRLHELVKQARGGKE